MDSFGRASASGRRLSGLHCHPSPTSSTDVVIATTYASCSPRERTSVRLANVDGTPAWSFAISLACCGSSFSELKENSPVGGVQTPSTCLRSTRSSLKTSGMSTRTPRPSFLQPFIHRFKPRDFFPQYFYPLELLLTFLLCRLLILKLLHESCLHCLQEFRMCFKLLEVLYEG